MLPFTHAGQIKALDCQLLVLLHLSTSQNSAQLPIQHTMLLYLSFISMI
jgi:hypothetical protein